MNHHVFKYDSSPLMGKSVLWLSFAFTYKTVSLALYNMVNNQTPCVIMKVIAYYYCIYNVID